jgi:hypothetical protein
MIGEGWIPMSAAAEAEIKTLVSGGKVLSGLSRRDPLEQGPVLASFADGSAYAVNDDGTSAPA